LLAFVSSSSVFMRWVQLYCAVSWQLIGLKTAVVRSEDDTQANLLQYLESMHVGLLNCPSELSSGRQFSTNVFLWYFITSWFTWSKMPHTVH
jgi:hypothetical protein